MDIAIDQIDPDPDQPRKQFDAGELAALAETIRRFGILQPLALRRAPTAGKWIISHGERRWRAAALAGLKTVPAFEEKRGGEEDSRRATQVIENQHRTGLANSEIAAVIAELGRERMKDEELSLIVGLPKQQLKHYRALHRLPEPLQLWVDRLDARTVYELYLGWEKADKQRKEMIAARLDALGTGSLSVTDARRLLKSLGLLGDPPEGKAAVPGDVAVKRQRVGPPREMDLLRETIDRLATLLRSAAEMLRQSNINEAERLLREADNAQAHVSSAGR